MQRKSVTRRQRPLEQKESAAKQEWERRKDEHFDSNAPVDELMELVGLEEIKEQFLAILAKVEVCKSQEIELDEERFNAVFQGNPGTGKTTVARIYAEFLHSIGALGCDTVEETSGAKLASEGPKVIQQKIKALVDGGGGVLFIDEAYQLTADYTSNLGRSALDIILTEMENNIGKLVVIFVGYNKDMQSFFEHNQGLRSRITYTLQFADFEDFELWDILQDKINNKYDGRMKIQGGMDGLYMRIAIRRLALGRGIRGFGNARAVVNLLAQISERQAKRLTEEKKMSLDPEYFLFTKEDLIGPNPSQALKSKAWAALQGLIGLGAVKSSVESMIGMLETNYLRELSELSPLNISLNQVFYGAPGVGKTSVAKLYGQIMADLGLLSDGEVVAKNPSDFIGSFLGKSEEITRNILAATVGKVLIIDEAYMLYSGRGEGQNDSYKTAVIDTLVAEVQGVPGDDQCIILLGYEDKLKEMFQNVNPGLHRRFGVDHAFTFENFNVPQLKQILEQKMEQQDLRATPEALSVACDVLDRVRIRPNYSNAGEVVTLLDRAKINHQTRQLKRPPVERVCDVHFEPVDFDPKYARHVASVANVQSQLQNLVGGDIIQKLEDYLKLGHMAKFSGFHPCDLVPTNILFKGPSGVGKTTTARAMGKLFYDMGFLSTDEVVECSASDLMGQYVGETCPKTRAQLERGLGKVLFVDEAFRLVEGHYAAEAVRELEYRLKLPRYSGRMIVILAGSTLDMDYLMAVKPTLSSLFSEEIVFQKLKPEECLTILARELNESRIKAPFLKRKSSITYTTLCEAVEKLSDFPSWGNARSVKSIAMHMRASVVKAALENLQGGPITPSRQGQPVGNSRQWIGTLTAEQALSCVKEMLEIQLVRCAIVEIRSEPTIVDCVREKSPPAKYAPAPPIHEVEIRSNVVPPPSKIFTCHTPQVMEKKTDAKKKLKPPHQSPAVRTSARPQLNGVTREHGVSNAVWKQLQIDKKAEEEAMKHRHADAAKEKEEIMEKLRKMGLCEYGFEWIKTPGGYRCEGGAHFVSDNELSKRA